MAPAPWRPSVARVLGLLVGGVVALLWWWSQGGGGPATDAVDRDTPSARASSAEPTHDYTSTVTPSTEPGGTASDPVSGLPVIGVGDLPAEAREVLARIDAGGPFDFPEHDGGVFQNREGLLPDRPLGHYREYTVDDGVGDRGPRRIVAGADGERYWTDDHYRSFSWIEVER